MKREKLTVAVCDANGSLFPSSRLVTVSGTRNIQTLKHLIEAGDKGVSTMDHWAVATRLSAYVHRLRKFGLQIETKNERAGGVQFGKYILRSAVILPEDAARVAA